MSSQELDTTLPLNSSSSKEMAINWWMDIRGIGFNSKERWSTCFSVDEPWNHHAVERCKAPDTTYHRILFIWNVQNRQIHKDLRDEWLPGVRKWGRGGHCDQNQVSCWCDEKVELESCGGWTSVKTEKHWVVHFKRVNFIVRIESQWKRKCWYPSAGVLALCQVLAGWRGFQKSPLPPLQVWGGMARSLPSGREACNLFFKRS